MTTVPTMASAISSPSCLSSSSYTTRKPTFSSLSNSLISYPQTSNSRLPKWNPQLGFGPFLQWNGLKRLGTSISQQSVKRVRKRKCEGKVVYASLFGVGAPEALVIGVVALLVFGPKGLAEVARNLGKTLRAFQPTIRELQEVSRDFKSTLEKEIGLDDIQGSTQNTYSSRTISTPSMPPSDASFEGTQPVVDPNGASSSVAAEENRAYSSEDYLKITEEQLKASAALQQQQTSPVVVEEIQSQSQVQQQQDTVQEAAVVTPPLPNPSNDA